MMPSRFTGELPMAAMYNMVFFDEDDHDLVENPGTKVAEPSYEGLATATSSVARSKARTDLSTGYYQKED
jgi:hypothetical protein